MTGSSIAGIEAVLGGGGNDVLVGDSNFNWLDGRGGNDTVQGMDGVDTLLGGTGNNLLDGMGGEDVVNYTWAAAAIAVDLGAGRSTHEGGADTISNVEHAVCGAFGDTIAGSAIGNYLQGGGGGGDDVFGGTGRDTLSAGLGADTLDGGDGFDLVDFAVAGAGMRANLDLGVESVTGTVLLSLEGAIGGGVADLLDGDENDNWLDGRGGNDTLHGYDGQDTMMGGLGQNALDGGAGGDDVLRYDWTAGAVFVDLAAGSETRTGTALTAVEAVIGSNFGDGIRGDAAGNWLFGGAGNDTLEDRAGSDSLLGAQGADVIVYGAGDGYDAIFEFESGADVIDASAYSADPNFRVQVFEYGSDPVIAFGGADNLYLVGKSLATFDVDTDLRL